MGYFQLLKESQIPDRVLINVKSSKMGQNLGRLRKSSGEYHDSKKTPENSYQNHVSEVLIYDKTS